jgi:hypothetical protein
MLHVEMYKSQVEVVRQKSLVVGVPPAVGVPCTEVLRTQDETR